MVDSLTPSNWLAAPRVTHVCFAAPVSGTFQTSQSAQIIAADQPPVNLFRAVAIQPREALPGPPSGRAGTKPSRPAGPPPGSHQVAADGRALADSSHPC